MGASAKGRQLFGLDLQRVKRDLEMVPLIETAAVDRVLPETLRLRITERRPLAQVIGYKQQGDGGLRRVRYWIDGKGVVIPPIDPADHYRCAAQMDAADRGLEGGIDARSRD